MALTIVMRNGKECVRIPTKFITVKGRRIYAHEYGIECFFIYIPIEKFKPSRYRD